MSTVGDLLKTSLRLVGVIASGETPSASEQSDALASLNRMLGSWSTQGLMIPNYAREVFLLEAGKAQYTMGATGDFNTTRPTQIVRAASTTPEINTTMTDPGDPLADPVVPPTYVTTVLATQENPIEIIPNVDRWADVTLKRLESSLVSKIYIEGTSPKETIHVWPVPNVQTALVLYSHKAISSFADAADEVELPDGYEDLIVYGLAVRLAPEFGKQIDPMIIQTAMELKGAIKRANSKPVFLKSDALGMTGRKSFNIYTGR